MGLENTEAATPSALMRPWRKPEAADWGCCSGGTSADKEKPLPVWKGLCCFFIVLLSGSF